MKRTLIAALIALLLLMPLIIYGCSSPEETTETEGFAIYLTRDDTPVSTMPILSHIEIADGPVFTVDDIISYDKDTHEIELTYEAYKRVTKLVVPTTGRSFIVCVDRNPIYWGAFWTPISSQSFDGVTIWTFPFSQQGNIIKLELGYPSPDFYEGQDPRSNPEIMQSLEQAGKLKQGG